MSETERTSVLEDVEAFTAYVRDWLDAQDVPSVPDDLDTRFDVLREWQRRLYDAGLIGIAWPTSWGGQGLTVHHQQAFTDALAAARAPQPIGLIGLDVVGPSIARFAAPDLRDELMPSLLSGEEIWCQGFSEPGAGSDLAALSTRATRDGDELVVTGQKTWTSWAHKAARCALLARTSTEERRHDGISYLAVDMSSPGVSVRPVAQMTGESEFCEVFFDEVRVPVRNVIGEVGAGWSIAMDTLAHERGTYSLRRRVEVSVPFDDAVSELRRECQDGAPPPPEGVIEAIGRSEVSLCALRAQTWATLQRLAAGGKPSPMDSVDKLVMSAVEQEVFGTLKDLVGAFPTVTDLEVAGLRTGLVIRDYLYGRAGSIYGGSAEIQRNIVAERHLGLPRV